MRIRVVAILSVLLFVGFNAKAQEYSIFIDGRDTIYYNYAPVSQRSKPKQFKTNFIIAPLYTPATSFALGAAVQSSYNTINGGYINQSLLSVAAVASVKGMYSVDVSNSTPFRNGKHRITAAIRASSMPTKFWGIGYNAACTNSAIQYTRQHYSAQIGHLYRVVKHLHLGTQLDVEYSCCGKNGEAIIPLLSANAKRDVIATTISAIAKYDSRDSKQNPQKGLYVSLNPLVRPAWLSDAEKTSFGIIGSAAFYQKLWHGAVLAGELYTQLNSKHTPWQFYARLGDNHCMRGYYEGRFIDRNMATIQAELRQEIWMGIGVAAWGGAGNCFDSFANFKWQHTLPTYGLGVRWVASDNLVLRFDYGFGAKAGGKLINGALFAIGSAF